MNALLLPVSCPLVSRLQPKFWTIFFLINFCLLLLIFQSILFFFRVPTFVQECHRNVICTTFFSKSTFARVSNHHHLLVHGVHGFRIVPMYMYKEFLYIFFACTYCAARPRSTRTYFFFFFWCKTHFFSSIFLFADFLCVVRFFFLFCATTCIITVFYLFYTSFNITILLLSTQKHPPCMRYRAISMWLSWLYFPFVQTHTHDIQKDTQGMRCLGRENTQVW